MRARVCVCWCWISWLLLRYEGGIYQHVTGSYEGGHAVRIVGWGTENSTDYWTVSMHVIFSLLENARMACCFGLPPQSSKLREKLILSRVASYPPQVANSWNPYWGEEGYFRILRGSNECGIEAEVTASSGGATWALVEA